MENYLPTNYAYSAMGNGRSDYDAYYGITDDLRYIGWHCHDFYELYIHLRGAKYYSVDNQVYILKPNQFLFIPPFRMHGLMASNTLYHYERAFIYIAPGFLKYLGCGQIDMEQMFNDLSRKGRYIFNMEEAAARECARHLDSVYKSSPNHQPWDRFSDLTHILPTLKLMLEAAHTSSESIPAVTENPLMYQILNYIEQHYTEPLSLKFLSEQFNISASSLSHQFLSYTHHSVYEYILYKRVMMAKQRLIENVPPGEVAYQCGFGDYSNFLRAFQRISGLSPSQYRREVQANAHDS